jgi:ubiquinone/menaquinone biosynthesis C-methylase UbiE
VGFYSKFIFPHLCDLALGQERVAKYRRELLADVGGDILEIGFGTGLNLAHYPAHVRKIVTVDPNPGMNRRAMRRIQEARIEVDHRMLSGERLPFQDRAFDCVVSTFTLCSIDNVNGALKEVFRVLRPDGRFFFFEHGQSPEPRIQKWQRRLNWLEMRIGEGCRLDRKIRELIAGEPFASIKMNEFYMEKSPKTHGYIYRGIATK